MSPSHLFSLLEMYNFETDMFTPLSKLGLVLHEMFEVSALSMGEVPYAEYNPTTEELNMLNAKDEHIYETYCDIMCHFRICTDISSTRSYGVGHNVWATYLFRNQNKSLRSIMGHKATEKEEVERHTVETRDVSYTAEFNEWAFKASTVCNSFYYQARFPVSSQGLIASFIMLWLKRCIIPSLPKVAIAINVAYPVVLLVYE